MSARTPDDSIRDRVTERVAQERLIANRFLNPDDYPWMFDESYIEEEIEAESPRRLNDPDWDYPYWEYDDDGREAMGSDLDY